MKEKENQNLRDQLKVAQGTNSLSPNRVLPGAKPGANVNP